MDKTILLVDQNRGLLALFKLALGHEGFTVIAAQDGKEGMRKAYRNRPDAIVLGDVSEVEGDWTLFRQLRQVCDTPIVILSAKAHEEDIVKGLSLGADAYLTKPCTLGELGARIRAVLRRTGPSRSTKDNVYDDGRLCVDLWREVVAVRGETVNLTPIESRLLMYLVNQRGRIVPHQELMTQVWGPEYAGEKRYLAVYIRHLRQKLEDDPARPRYICTRWHVGYYFSGKDASSGRRSAKVVRMPRQAQVVGVIP
jgi:two-component system KDP operon response regulator KdpE